eukprot:TRINITY_DN37508_c0_g1_i1.p1 TRINITY_DN37508_c0_g1~~TRINITY_DN37508_c0_g1_i1.p1  ORF type:complete len:578 (+),score=171.64 TRINITY_DN37508_c0_g1_i1:70-1803(+)
MASAAPIKQRHGHAGGHLGGHGGAHAGRSSSPIAYHHSDRRQAAERHQKEREKEIAERKARVRRKRRDPDGDSSDEESQEGIAEDICQLFDEAPPDVDCTSPDLRTFTDKDMEAICKIQANIRGSVVRRSLQQGTGPFQCLRKESRTRGPTSTPATAQDATPDTEPPVTPTEDARDAAIHSLQAKHRTRRATRQANKPVGSSKVAPSHVPGTAILEEPSSGRDTPDAGLSPAGLQSASQDASAPFFATEPELTESPAGPQKLCEPVPPQGEQLNTGFESPRKQDAVEEKIETLHPEGDVGEELQAAMPGVEPEAEPAVASGPSLADLATALSLQPAGPCQPGAALVPKRPSGPPPPPVPGRRRPVPAAVPLEDEVLSDDGIQRWAQKNLEKIMAKTMKNVARQKARQVSEEDPRVKLENLPRDTQERLRRVARVEAAQWLEKQKEKAAEAQRKSAKYDCIQNKLAEWHEQKEKMRQLEQERKREQEEEEERAKQKENIKWKRRAEVLQRKVGNWAVQKADKDWEDAKQAEEKAKQSKEAEQRRRKRRQAMLKEQLRQRAMQDLAFPDPKCSSPADAA